MKTFFCDNCGMMVFFENDHCEQCGGQLGFSSDTLVMVSEKKRNTNPPSYFKTCANRQPNQVCNWLVPDNSPSTFCLACSLNETIPDLNVAGNVDRWRKLEAAKRRCVYGYLRLGLPIEVAAGDNSAPLRFKFLADKPDAPVITGHDHGLITVNIAESDGDERERRRLNFHEPYRTIVGHFRHETGHYYWDRLVADSNYLPRFRALFGDETWDYGEAMKAYYQNGPANDWRERTITPYASWHPWEDWAETWAHYLHIVDTMETAASFGLSLSKPGEQRIDLAAMPAPPASTHRDFDSMMNNWLPLTLALNSINRGMGLSDLYPFVIPKAVVEKLRFIHNLIEAEARRR